MSTRQHARTIRKRSFLLFELLISMALITLCLFPLMKTVVSMRQADRKNLEEIQLEKAAQNAFCYVKALLYENKNHKWKELSAEVSGELSETFPIVTSKESCRTYHCTYQIKKIGTDAKKPNQNKIGRALTIELTFYSGLKEHPPFSRTVYVEKQT